MTGRLTTHVLDTAHGRPAAGMSLRLKRLEATGTKLITERRTNADGRCDGPLIEGATMQAGQYELTFAAGDYFAALGVTLPEPPFLDEVVICFGISDATMHYHVPLLISPYGYSTYRGS